MIEAVHISKKFGDFKVLSDINFQVQEGEIYGLIGYNGVGKTTLMKILCGVYRPDEGSVTINGVPVYENAELKRQCFFMTEEATFFAQASLNQMRRFYRGYYPGWNDTTFDGLVKWFGVDPDKKIGQFSKGMQRQASLTLAFSTRARYLFLDEAFDGLDVSMRCRMREMLQYYAKAKNATLLVSSHNLKELEDLVDHIGMLSEGELIFDDSTKRMKESYQTCQFTFEGKKEELADLQTDVLQQTLQGYTCILNMTEDEAYQHLVQAGAKDIRIRPVELEEFFRKERKEQEVEWEEIFC
jgi:ABC-2 type transport system ATP-binding protein